MKTKKKDAHRPANYGTAKRCPDCGFKIRSKFHESGEHHRQASSTSGLNRKAQIGSK